MKHMHLVLLLLVVLISQTSCFRNYYVTREKPLEHQQELRAIADTTKMVFIHYDDSIVLARNLAMQDSMLVGTLEAYPNHPADSLFPAFQVGPHAIRRKKLNMVCAQVHVFVQQPMVPASGILRLAPQDILHIQTYQFDKKRSAASHTLGFMAVSAAIVATVGFFVILMDSFISF